MLITISNKLLFSQNNSLYEILNIFNINVIFISKNDSYITNFKNIINNTCNELNLKYSTINNLLYILKEVDELEIIK